MTAEKSAPAESAPAKGTSSRNEAPGIMKRGSSYFVDPTTICRREGWNNRFDFGEIEELAGSLAEQGMLMPLRIKRIDGHPDGKLFVLVDGDRRLTAIEHLLKDGPLSRFPALAEGVPAIIVDKKQEDLKSLIQMFVANTGKPLLPLEEASAYKRMQDAGMGIMAIASAVGRKHVHVVATLALLQADTDVQEAVEKGEVTPTLAKKIATGARGDKAKQKELIAQAKAAGKDQGKKKAVEREIEKVRKAKAEKKGRTIKIRALSDVELSELGSRIAKHLVTLMKEAGLDVDKTDLRKLVKEDDKLAVAATFGALEALKKAAGADIDIAF